MNDAVLNAAFIITGLLLFFGAIIGIGAAIALPVTGVLLSVVIVRQAIPAKKPSRDRR